jgi:hypothetical protein
MTYDEWRQERIEYDWPEPIVAPAWKRLPGIRYVRTLWNVLKVSIWYTYGPGSMGIPTGYDSWVLYGMRRGWV